MRKTNHVRLTGWLFSIATALTLSAGLVGAQAQDYPTRPVAMVVTWGPGGGADQTGRIIAKLLEGELKVSVPVENVPGSSGVTGLNKLLNGEADGYQIGLLTADTYALLAGARPQRWSLADLAPLAVLVKQHSALFVAADSPYKTWADVAAAAKTKELKVAVTGLGTVDEIGIEELKQKFGLKLVAVPFAKPGERYASVLGGHADLVFEQAGDIKGFIDSKQIRPVLFLSQEKVAQFPDVTTTKDLGMDLVLDLFRTVMAKAGTPEGDLKVLRDAIGKAVKTDEYQKYLADAGATPDSVVIGPDATAFIESQIKLLKSHWQ